MSLHHAIAFVPPSELAGLDEKTPVLLAFSGGADSRALLHLLAEDAREKGYSLLLAHVNHGIRGEEALSDRDFCRRVADVYGLEICVLDVDVPALAAKNRRGLEEEAREVRYAFFARLMEERGIPLLATAHHADDNLETLLFRLSRGTTGQGLCGIAPKRAFGGGYLVRPLLGATRAEILDFCREKALEFVTDSTNADTHYARNRLRAEVVPVLEELFPSVAHRTLALCEEIRQDEALLQSLAGCCLENACTERGVSLSVLCETEAPILRRALRSYLRRCTGVTPERVHLDAVEELVRRGRNGDRTALPKDFSAVIEAGSLVILPNDTGEGCDFEIPFTHGVTHLPDSGIVIRTGEWEEMRKVHNLSTTACINLTDLSAIMEKTLYWRNQREGDTLLRCGMHKKLRKLYNQNKIPPRLRAKLPLLCDGEGIVWAPFVGLRDGVRTDGGLSILVELPQDLRM